VLSAVAADEIGEVHFAGTNNQLAGMQPGVALYLSTTAGQVTEIAPSGTGNVVQFIGFSYSDTEMSFEPHQPIELA
jgi:hypothetical protein